MHGLGNPDCLGDGIQTFSEKHQFLYTFQYQKRQFLTLKSQHPYKVFIFLSNI